MSKSSTLPAPTFYYLDDTSIVLDYSCMSDFAHSQKQRLVNFVARHMLHQDSIQEAVSGDESVTFYVQKPQLLAMVEQQCNALWQQFDESDLCAQHHVVPVNYGGRIGIDLGSVAERVGLSQSELIEAHCSIKFDVDFLGFQPGFAYMSGLPKQLQLPRLDLPRTQVHKGSVAIAGDKTAIYPANSPGGWHIIGHTHINLFDPSRDPASLFAPGDTVSFVEEK